MIYKMRAEINTVLTQYDRVMECTAGTELYAIAFSPSINHDYYLVALLDMPGTWIMFDPPEIGVWNVCEAEIRL